MRDIREALEREWQVFMENKPGNRSNWTMDQKWRADNPRELQLLTDYRDGSARPQLSTEPGRRMLEHLDAYLLTLEEIPVPPEPSGWPPKETAPPAFTPIRIVTVTTVAAFNAAMSDLRAGDRVNVAGITLNGQINFHQQLAAPAEILFGRDVRLVGGGAAALNAAWLKARNLRLFGGTLSNPTGHGLLVYASADSGWWDFKVDGVGGTAFRVLTPDGHVERCTFVGEVTNVGNEKSLDPHADKGSGLHPSYIGGVPDVGIQWTTRDCKFAIDAHDCKTGSNQIGPHGERNKHWYRCKNLTYQPFGPNYQTGGNACQPFGNVQDCQVWLEADNVHKAVEPSWLSAGHVTVTHARATGVRNPPAYVASPRVTYQDCQ